jgi:hypothetical protein
MKGAAIALLTIALSSCAAMRPDAVDSGVVSDIVAGAARLSRAAADEQTALLAAARRSYAEQPSDANRVRLAALLASATPPARSESQAAQLLEPVASRRPETPLVSLAALLAASLREREQLASAARANQERAGTAEERLRVANERASAANERANSLNERASALNDRLNTLRQQLDALKSAERGMLEREEKLRMQKK